MQNSAGDLPLLAFYYCILLHFTHGCSVAIIFLELCQKVAPNYAKLCEIMLDAATSTESRASAEKADERGGGTPIHFFFLKIFASFTLWGRGTVRLTGRPLG